MVSDCVVAPHRAPQGGSRLGSGDGDVGRGRLTVVSHERPAGSLSHTHFTHLHKLHLWCGFLSKKHSIGCAHACSCTHPGEPTCSCPARSSPKCRVRLAHVPIHALCQALHWLRARLLVHTSRLWASSLARHSHKFSVDPPCPALVARGSCVCVRGPSPTCMLKMLLPTLQASRKAPCLSGRLVLGSARYGVRCVAVPTHAPGAGRHTARGAT